MKSISIVMFCLMLGFLGFGQSTKIKVADSYFQSYRFADAKEIYSELIFKDKLDVNQYMDLYRNAVQSSIKCNDYWFALKIYEKMVNSEKFDSDDAYALFKLNNFLGRYEKLDDLLQMPQITGASGAKKELLEQYANQKPWVNLMKDTAGSTISFATFNSAYSDFGPVLYPGGLAFSSTRNNNGAKSKMDMANFTDNYIYQFSSKKVKAVSDILHKRHDGASYYDTLSKLWYVSKNLSPTKEKTLTTTGIFIQNSVTGNEIAFPFNSNNYFIAQPYFDRNDQRLYFSSNMPGGLGGADIWYSNLQDGNWTEPVNAGPGVNTFEDEMFPHKFGNTFYFSSNGHIGLGGLDIFQSEMSNNQFGKPKNMGYPLNSYGDDLSLVLESNGETGYYSANRKDYEFMDHIYAFKLVKVKIIFEGMLYAEFHDPTPLENIAVLVTNSKDEVLDTIYSDASGKISYPLEKDETYHFILKDDKYEDHTEVVATIDAAEEDTIRRDIGLVPKFVLLSTIVRDKKSQEPLPNTTLSFEDKSSGEIKKYTSDENGRLKVELPRNREYDILASKKNYLDDQANVNTFTKEKNLQNEMILDLNLVKITSGTTIQVENVFYDLNKANLRPESRVELDKLAQFLLKNDNIKVELSSHTDSRGSDSKNQVLSQARAQSCVDYLIDKGVQVSNIVAKGYGESKIINRCKNGVKCSEAEHQLNRRTEIKILSISE